MSLEIQPFILGPLENNTYLISDSETHQAVIIDPAMGSAEIIEFIREHNLTLQAIWLTHAHFDHIAGIEEIHNSLSVPVGLHPADLDLWTVQGGAQLFGMKIHPGPKPGLLFADQQNLVLGYQNLTVLHTPGHTRGHVCFYSPQAEAVFCGDLIFQSSVGRTDLPGGSLRTLMESIQTRILTLPPQTRLLPGHGEETRVGIEAQDNPFLQR